VGLFPADLELFEKITDDFFHELGLLFIWFSLARITQITRLLPILGPWYQMVLSDTVTDSGLFFRKMHFFWNFVGKEISIFLDKVVNLVIY